MKRILILSFSIALCAIAGVKAHAQVAKKKCRLHCGVPIFKAYDLSSSSVSGDQVRGPATVRADNLNVLRYDHKFSLAVTFSAAPDLWSKLQSIANPAAPAAPEKPTPSATSPSPQIKLKVSKTVEDLLDKAEAALSESTNAITGAERAVAVAVGSRDPRQDCKLDNPADLDVAKETNRESNCLTDLVAMSTSGVSQVKGAGQALVGLLQKKWVKPDLLIAYINDALASKSAFTAGVTASWPDFKEIAAVKQSSTLWKAELANRTSKFGTDAIVASGSLTSTAKSLITIQQALVTKEKTTSGNDQSAIESAIQRIQTTLGSLDAEGKNLAKTTTLLGWAVTENQRVISLIPDLEQSSTKYTDFQAAKDTLRGWNTRMSDLRDRWNAYKAPETGGKTEEENPNPFSLSTSADCEFSFSRTKTTTITLTRVDLLPGTTLPGPETILSLSVECTSPFTASAGVEFSTIGKREFAIQASPSTPPATGTVNKFVITNDSSFHPLPLGMIHARLCEFNETLAVHASFGLAGNIQSQNAGGSSAEFLIGPSFSLFRTMFVTPGLQIGTKTEIGAGFRVGDMVPSNITAVPLIKSYTTGFGLAITFTKP